MNGLCQSPTFGKSAQSPLASYGSGGSIGTNGIGASGSGSGNVNNNNSTGSGSTGDRSGTSSALVYRSKALQQVANNAGSASAELKRSRSQGTRNKLQMMHTLHQSMMIMPPARASLDHLERSSATDDHHHHYGGSSGGASGAQSSGGVNSHSRTGSHHHHQTFERLTNSSSIAAHIGHHYHFSHLGVTPSISDKTPLSLSLSLLTYSLIHSESLHSL